MQSIGHWRQGDLHTQVRHMNTSCDNVLTLNDDESKLPGPPLAMSHTELKEKPEKGVCVCDEMMPLDRKAP